MEHVRGSWSTGIWRGYVPLSFTASILCMLLRIPPVVGDVEHGRVRAGSIWNGVMIGCSCSDMLRRVFGGCGKFKPHPLLGQGWSLQNGVAPPPKVVAHRDFRLINRPAGCSSGVRLINRPGCTSGRNIYIYVPPGCATVVPMFNRTSG